jgi:hypothetical protein
MAERNKSIVPEMTLQEQLAAKMQKRTSNGMLDLMLASNVDNFPKSCSIF